MIPDDGSATRLGSIGIDRPPSTAASAFDEGGFTPGTVLLSRYRIVGLIGRGGMGELYRAQDLKPGQSVALKFLPESMQRDPTRLERFLSEVRVARQILLRLTRVLTESLLILFMLLLLLIVLRSRWLAYAVVIGLFLALSFPTEQVLAGVVGIAAMVGIIVVLVSRFGVLAYTAPWFVNYTVSELPFSFDGWFATRSVITAALLMTVAGWGFYRSLGGPPAFGAAFD